MNEKTNPQLLEMLRGLPFGYNETLDKQKCPYGRSYTGWATGVEN